MYRDLICKWKILFTEVTRKKKSVDTSKPKYETRSVSAKEKALKAQTAKLSPRPATTGSKLPNR